ncbi:LytTR family DNA-binding domain-containing protein [uncultured Brevundimonas sp.]|uniref:LytTR family DNA-binding domain-containing protein n=1 Tax=uncultured Brevundimonas sp. TaxID=213418 RepID=UPI0030EE0BC5|tara:strand:+ start:476 stop:1249 length:774 start_codon:yes stop_codon:yes gene_type:complete
MIRTLAAFRLGRSGVAELAALVLFGLFLGAVGPFSTDGIPTVPRYLYWQLAIVGGGLIAAVIEPMIARRLAGRPRLFALAQLLAMTPPIAVWVTLVPLLFFGMPASVAHALSIMPDVLTINVAVVILAWLTRRALRRHEPRALTAAGVAPPALRARLSPRLARARLIAVEAEDHYLRIRTEAGSDLILMRFADALAALDTADGFRTHRSWWVARTAVESARWKAGRGRLVLSDGSAAPVSRTYAAALKGTDWAAPVG